MKKEIRELQKYMLEEGVDVYYVPSGDPHCSEYMNDHYKVSQFLSGLHAENEELVITEDAAYIWTDGRFFLQAEIELEGSGIRLMKMKEPGVPTVTEFLKERIKDFGEKHPTDNFVIGYDGRTLPAKTGLNFEKELQDLLNGTSETDSKCGRLRFKWDEDLGGKVWGSDRPEIIPSKIWELPVKYTGMGAAEKIAAVREEMKAKGADYLLLSDLMETAWLLNLRGDDILYTPVFFSYILLGMDSVRLYVMDGALDDITGTDPDKMPEGIKAVEVRSYEEVFSDAAKLPHDAKVWLDSESVNYSLYLAILDECMIIDGATPVSLMKTVKNSTEIECTRNAHIRDGAAVTSFIYWVKEAVKTAGDESREERGKADAAWKLTEITASDYLAARRREQKGCFDLSFPTIAGYGPNGAIIHYTSTAETDLEIKPEGFFLVDSGGQYYDGTTDITRTIAVGPLTSEMIDRYTRVLKGHIAMSRYIITPGTRYSDIDGASRAALKEAGLDFNHGVGHGVGHVLSVHEGPAGIKRTDDLADLKPGMIISNEPGVYIAGEYGIRIENEVVILDAGDGNLISEPITMVPYEREAIDVSMLTEDEIAWVDRYHITVREKLLPLLDDETAEFLIKVTQPLAI